MTNDKVTIRAEEERDGRFKGEIIRINDRAQKKIAGRLLILKDKNENPYALIKDEGKGWGADLRIKIEDTMNAESGELVSAEIISYPEPADYDSRDQRAEKKHFTGKVIEVIGDADSALNDIRRVIINQNIPDVFSQATLNEAKKFSHNPTEADFKDRKDLRGLKIITIDGATAKDFDDAVYTEVKPNGFHLYVAIADVSHYVKSETAMDADAYERGTSVYFPNFVVSMLPEALSNGLCSLNPHVPRLALVAEMNFDFEGTMTHSKFYEAVIESQARVTYGEAQEIVDGVEIEKFNHVKENILRCADLAKVLMARRFKDGSLDLEVPETELVIDGTGEPIDVIKSERLFAHRLIEELMLAANVAVAKFLAGKDIPSMYRIHEPPDPLKISLLQRFIGQLGSKAKFSGEKLQKQLTKALQEFHGKPQASIIHILTLRSMSQAKYTIDNLGHFGLGFDFYTHFTSPIRRYPDLIVHRLIKNQIGVPGYHLLAAEDLQTAGTWLSACEQRSAKSERQIQAIKKARFMKKMEGETFEGMISSITKFGLFVLLKQYNVDGLVRLEDLGTNNTWVYDEENLRLVSKKTGYAYNIGDNLKVTVSMVDIEQGQINFVPEGTVAKVIDRKDKNYRPEKAEIKTHRSFENKKLEIFGKKGSGNSSKEHLKSKTKEKPQENSFDHVKPIKKANTSNPDTIKKSLRLRTIENNAEVNKPEMVNEYEIKPRYSSLSDYLDKNKMKSTETTYDQKPKYKSSSNEKSSAQSLEARENAEKRGKTSGHPSRSGKTRFKQSGRKNKSR